MLTYRIGDRVRFRPAGRPQRVGMLVRSNRKLVTIITDDGQRWNVAPALLSKAASEEPTTSSRVSALPRRHR